MELTPGLGILMVLAGFAAGIVNTLAGSGSVFTLGILFFSGLPADIANGTNRVGVFLQGLISTSIFRKNKQVPWEENKPIALAILLGALVGAFIAVEIPKNLLEIFIGCIMVGLLLVVVFHPEKKWQQKKLSRRSQVIQWIIFFAIGIYGGFVQIGIGILLLTAFFTLTGLDAIKANGLKLLVVLIYSVPVLAIFAWNGQVNWIAGGLLAIGQAAGSLVGGRFAMKSKKAAKYIRSLLIIMIILSILRMFHLDSWVVSLFR